MRISESHFFNFAASPHLFLVDLTNIDKSEVFIEKINEYLNIQCLLDQNFEERFVEVMKSKLQSFSLLQENELNENSVYIAIDFDIQDDNETLFGCYIAAKTRKPWT